MWELFVQYHAFSFQSQIHDIQKGNLCSKKNPKIIATIYWVPASCLDLYIYGSVAFSQKTDKVFFRFIAKTESEES